MELSNYNIDDSLMSEYQASDNTTGGTVSNWFKPESDKDYHIRILPIGNDIEKIPFVERVIHDLSYMDVDENGAPKKVYKMVTCWDHLLQKKLKTFAKSLAEQQKLTKSDLDLYKAHRCPVCAVNRYFLDVHQDKKTANKFYAQTKYIWNIVVRPNKKEAEAGKNSQSKIFACSAKIWRSIIDSYLEAKTEESIDILNPETGFDWVLSVKGSGIQRRYDIRVKAALKGVPVGEFEGEPADLVKVYCDAFVPYQDTIDALKRAYGALLTDHEYVIPGDRSVTEATNSDDMPF